MNHDQALSAFIAEHIHDNPAQLVLAQKGKIEGIDVQEAAKHIAALQKIKAKVPDWYNPTLRFGSALSVEQCSSAATARFKAGLVRGKRLLDLSGGLGIDTYYMAAQFEEAVYVEQDKNLVQCAAHNFMALQRAHIACVHDTAEHYLEQLTQTFDVIYIDPARRNSAGRKVFDLSDCSPDVLRLRQILLSRITQTYIIKVSPMLDIRAALRQMQTITDVYVLGYQDECKELVLVGGKEDVPEHEAVTHAIELDALGLPLAKFAATYQEEAACSVPYSMPQLYIYDLPPAMHKAGINHSIAKAFGLSKLHAGTHLFTSSQLVEGVPGRCFVLEAVVSARKEEVMPYLPKAKANLRARNFPDTTEVLAKRLGIKDGGDIFLFAVTLADNSLKVLVTKKK